jgi:hypothetical protein
MGGDVYKRVRTSCELVSLPYAEAGVDAFLYRPSGGIHSPFRHWCREGDKPSLRAGGWNYLRRGVLLKTTNGESASCQELSRREERARVDVTP